MITAKNFREVLALPCVVVENPKMIFFRVPKAASTSIHRGYLAENYDTLNVKTSNKRFFQWMKSVTFDWFTKAYKFTFVRNPWDRFVSLYVYFTTYVPKSKGSPLAYRFKRDNEPIPTFLQFVDNFDDLCGRREDIRNHTLPQHIFAFHKGTQFVDYIGRFEHLDLDMSRVQLSQKLVYERLEHRMRTDHDHYRSFYNDDTRRKVGKMFKKDVKLFDYEF